MPNFLTPSKNPSKTALDLLLFATRKNIRREKPSIPPCRTRCTLAQLQSKLINKLWGKWTALMIYGLCVNVLNPAFVLSSIFSNISSHPCCSTFPKPDEEVDWRHVRAVYAMSLKKPVPLCLPHYYRDQRKVWLGDSKCDLSRVIFCVSFMNVKKLNGCKSHQNLSS